MQLTLTKHSLISFLLKASYFIALGFFLLDFVFYLGFVKNNLIVSPVVIMTLIAAAHIAVRYTTRIKLPDEFALANLFVIAPTVLLLSAVAASLEEHGFLYPNYFFVNFDLHYWALPFVALPASIFGVLHASKQFWIDRWKTAFFLFSSCLTILATLLYVVKLPLYSQLTSEDNLIENLSALCFIIAGSTAITLVRKRNFFRSKTVQNIFALGCVLVGISFLVVAGEEISWGQRLFNITTPESFAEYNRQGEINLHNTEALWKSVYAAYTLIGLYGALVWIAEWFSKDLLKLNAQFLVWKRLFVPSGYFMLNFSLIVIYVWLREKHGYWRFQPWEEFSELLLAMAIATHLLQQYFTFPKRSSKR